MLRSFVRAKGLSTGKPSSGLGQQHASTARGAPSTSTDLKEALCEKIPLQHDLLRQLRRRHGSSVITQITIDDMYRGLNGVRTMVRETSEVGPKSGITYRGLTIPEVVSLLPRRGSSPSPEAVFWLLLTGDVPTYEQTASLVADWTSRRRRRRMDRWSEVAGTVLRALPRSVSPLGRLCIALTALQDADKHARDAVRNGAMSHTHWEYAYEDSMELLATLPALVSLVDRTQDLRNVAEEGDWVDFLLECRGRRVSRAEGRSETSSLGDFLRLYIAINADEDGGVPGAHVTQIVGDSQHGINQALAAGTLGYVNEPSSGTLHQCMDFQVKLQSALGTRPKESALKDYVRALVEGDDGAGGVTGYRESARPDPRYVALDNYVGQRGLEDPGIKLSREISKVVMPTVRGVTMKNVWPEQNAIAAPIFRFYGFRDMKFNQALLCMSRALGAVASVIWTKAVNMPVERPRSSCTCTYLDSIENVRSKPKRSPVKYAKHFPK